MQSIKFAVPSSLAFAVVIGLVTTAAPCAQSRPASSVEESTAAGFQAPPAAEPPPGAIAAPAPAVHPAVSELDLELREVLSRYNATAQAAVLVVSLDRGDTIFSFNPDVPLAPASNMKLFSTAAALYYLGPDFRYSTYLLGTGELSNGILTGDLVLYGTGDPSMSGRMLRGALTPLRALADTLAAQGVVEVRGDLIGDGSYFDSEWLGRGWSAENFGSAYSAPVGALSLAENVAGIRVQPGAIGAPGVITTIPATSGMAIVNRTITVAGGQTGVRFEYAPEGLVVSGRIARGHSGIERTISIVDPVNFTAAAFRSVLEDRGIRVTGQVRTVMDPEASPVTFAGRLGAARERGASPPRVLGIHLSPPLSELIRVTNHVSHNLFAEALLKTVGRVALGDGSFDGGARAIRYLMECEANADSAELAIVDGSGLSPLNRVTVRATIQLLDIMSRSPHRETYLASLPEAGHVRPRGLQRMMGTSAERNLRAKTGTIRNVSSLSGYVTAANGERLAFAIFANQLPASTWGAKRIEDAIGARLASFERPAHTADVGQLARSTDPDTLDRPVEDPTARAEASPTPQAEPNGNLAQQVPARSAVAAASPATPATHRIRSGDTLDGIAQRYGTSVAELQQLNPGLNPRRLQLGETVQLPG